jgi:hypothetical protein
MQGVAWGCIASSIAKILRQVKANPSLDEIQSILLSVMLSSSFQAASVTS